MFDLGTRRKKLFDSMKDNSVAILFSGVSKVASEDEYLPFTVNKNFFYLTNIKQEHSALMLIKSIGERRTYLFIDPYSELKEKWYWIWVFLPDLPIRPSWSTCRICFLILHKFSPLSHGLKTSVKVKNNGTLLTGYPHPTEKRKKQSRENTGLF